jgi:GxxExxY protein
MVGRHASCDQAGMATEQEINRIAHEIIGGGIVLHTVFGPGCFESTYCPCLAHEMKKRGLQFEAKVELDLRYEELWVPRAYEADFIVEGVVLVEVKALQAIAPVHLRQVKTYLTLSGCPLGLLMNFGAQTMRAGVRRVVNNFPEGTSRDLLARRRRGVEDEEKSPDETA